MRYPLDHQDLFGYFDVRESTLSVGGGSEALISENVNRVAMIVSPEANADIQMSTRHNAGTTFGIHFGVSPTFIKLHHNVDGALVQKEWHLTNQGAAVDVTVIELIMERSPFSAYRSRSFPVINQ